MPDTIETAKYLLDTGDSEQKLKRLSAETDKAAIAVTKQDRAIRTSLDGLLKWTAQLDKLSGVSRKHYNELEKLQRFRDDEVGSVEQLARVEELLTQKYDEQYAKVDADAKRHEFLTAKYDTAGTSAKKMAAEIDEVNEAFQRGINITGGYEKELQKIADKYNVVSLAAERAARAERERVTRAGTVSDSPYQASESEKASNAQSAFNQQLGVTAGDRRGVPTATASAFQDLADLEDAAAAAAERANREYQSLLAEFDPVTVRAQKMTAELARLNRAHELGIAVGERYRAEQARIEAQYNETGIAADKTAAEEEKLATVRRNATTRAGSYTPGTTGRSAASAETGNRSFFDILDDTDRTGAPTANNSALADAAAESEKLTAATEKYLNIVDPTREATLKYNAAIREANQLEKAGQLGPVDLAIAENKLTEVYEKQIHVLSGAADAERKKTESDKVAADAAARTAEEQKKLADTAQKFREQATPQAGIDRRYRDSLNEINELVRKGALGSGEASTITASLTREYDHLSERTRRAAGASHEISAGMLGATQQSRAMQFTLNNLGFQINDVATSLASGISPMQTFAQQAGQFVQVFSQGGGVKAVMTEFVGTLKNMATPLNAVIGLVAGLAVGFGVAVLKAIEIEGAVRKFNVALNGMGTQGVTSGENLERAVKQLKDMGVAADEARDAIQKVVRARDINPARAGGIATSGADLGAIRGSGTVSGTEEIVQALQDGPEALIKLGVELRKLEPLEISQTRHIKDVQGSIAAADYAYGIFAGRISGSYTSSLSESTKEWIKFKNAVDDFFRDAAVTNAVKFLIDELQGVLKGLNDTIKEIQAVIDNIKKARDWVSSQITNTTTAGDKATQGAQTARDDMDKALVQRDIEAGGAGEVRGTSRFTTSNITLNTKALDDLTKVLGEASRVLPEGYSLTATSGQRHRGGTSFHETGEAIDVQIVGPGGARLPNKGAIGTDPGLYKDLAIAAYKANQELFPGTNLTWGGRFETRSGSGDLDWMHFDRGPDRGRFGEPLATLAGGAFGRTPSQIAEAGKFPWRTGTGTATGTATGAATGTTTQSVFNLTDQTEQLDKQADSYRKANVEARKWADAQTYGEARLRGLEEAESQGIKGTAALEFADRAGKQAVEQASIARDKASTIVEKEISSQQRVADAFKVSTAAGYRASAQEEARIEVFQRGGNEALRTRQILETQAAQAIRTGREQVAAQNPVLAAQQKLVDATMQGTAAAQDQEIANAAEQRTLDALNRAIATGNPLLEAQAKGLNEAALQQEKLSASQKAGLQAAHDINESKLSRERTQLETNLTAQNLPTDQITLLTDNLTIVQKLNTDLRLAAPEVRDAYRDINVQLANAKYELTQIQREQQRWNDLVSALATKIDSELTTSIENAFSGEKVDDWGTRLKKWIGSAASSLSSSLFIKPALGTAAAALGFGGVAQSLGSFSALTGSGTSTGTGSGNVSITKNEDGTFSLSNVSSGASLLSSGSSLFGGSSGILSSVNSFGSSLGFASTVPALSTSEISSLGSLIGIDDKSLSFLGSSSTLNGSLFGGTTLTGALGSAGAGLGAGLTLNSLLGGTKVGGAVGSTAGSLTGSLVGSLFGPVGTLAGGLLGGSAGGVLGGLVGQKHTSNLASGLSIDLAGGTTSGFASAGSKENDKSVREISDALTSFTKDIQTTTKGTVSGSISPQVGEHGTKLDYNIPGFGSGSYDALDTQDAIDKAELAIARGLTGLTDNMKKVIDTITDPKDLDAAITFVKKYDKIADAAKDAFASVPSDLSVEGPFKKAKDELKDTFDALADDAKKYGLSVEPITEAQTEANKRLTEDFNRNMDDLITAAEDPLQSLVDIEKRAGAARLKDAKEVNGDIEKVNKYNKEALDKIWKDSTKSIVDFQKELKSGDLSGKTATQKIKDAKTDYDSLLTDVKSGKSAKFDDFVTSGKDLYNLYTEAYGAGPKTSGLRTDILAAIDDVLATRSFAKGGATLAGWNRVGEQGPEWMYTPSPSWVLPAGHAPGAASTDMREVTSVMRDVLGELRANTAIARIGHTETVDRLDAQLDEMGRPATFEPSRRKVAAAA